MADLAPPVAGAQDPAQWSIAQRQMDYVSYSKSMDVIMLELTKKVVQGDIQPKDAIGTVKMIRGEAEASLAGLTAESATGQQVIKAAVTTPPETALAQVFAQMASLSNTIELMNARLTAIAPAKA